MDEKLKRGILHAIQSYLKNKGFEEFKADLEEFDKPKKIVEKQSGEIFQPDLTATHKSAPYLFNIEMGDKLEQRRDEFVRMCNVLQEFATSRDGKLYLIVPIQSSDKVIAEINRNNLEDIGILQINVE
jgi:hypothetical protein